MEEKQNNQATDATRSGLTGWPLRGRLSAPKIVLASASPRRAEILRGIDWPFETLAVNIDESRRAGEAAAGYVERLAQEKAEAARISKPAQLVLGADTIVVVDGEILGKPRDADDARRMLRLLNGRWHQVLTGIALLHGSEAPRAIVAHEVTQVKFAEMAAPEIDWYVSTVEPMDKAGAYAIQGFGARFIERIEGDYYNVVGLPVRLLYQLVQQLLS
jgi:septum formation protein